jgi:hypothetical protein
MRRVRVRLLDEVRVRLDVRDRPGVPKRSAPMPVCCAEDRYAMHLDRGARGKKALGWRRDVGARQVSDRFDEMADAWFAELRHLESEDRARRSLAEFLRKAVEAEMSTTDRPFALRLYQEGEGSSHLLCRQVERVASLGIEAPMRAARSLPLWLQESEPRYTFPTPEAALAFFETVCGERPGFKTLDVRVVRVVPPQRETYVEVTEFGCPEPRQADGDKETR